MELSKVATEIQCIVMSSKNGVKLRNLQNDYSILLGRPLSFQKLGFQSLEDLIRAIPSYVRLIRKRGGDVFIEGVVDHSTSHMAKLVARQAPINRKDNKFRDVRRMQARTAQIPLTRPSIPSSLTPSPTTPSPTTPSPFTSSPMTQPNCGHDQQVYHTERAAIGSKRPMIEPSSWTVYRNPQIMPEFSDEKCSNCVNAATVKRQKVDEGGRFVPGIVGTPDNLYFVMPIQFGQGKIEPSIDNLSASLSGMNFRKPSFDGNQSRFQGSHSTERNKRILERLKSPTYQPQTPSTDGDKPTSFNSYPLPERVEMAYGMFVPSPGMPIVNSRFDVTVVRADNPDNIFVQEYGQLSKLSKLEKMMNMFYQDVNNMIPVDSWKLVPGVCFALKHIPVGNWYRVRLERIDSFNSKAVVNRIDYGDSLYVDLCHLQPLLADFCKFPSQAIMASLHGVNPIGHLWSQESKEAFQRLVLNRSLVSVVKSRQVSHGNNKLSLVLIDTSNDRDIFIDKELIRLNVATNSF